MTYELDAAAVRSARSDRGLTQTELGAKIGVAGGTRVSAWERGRAKPHPHQLRSLSRELGVPIAALLRPVGRDRRDLGRLRIEAGLSFVELAVAIQVPVQTVKRWERRRVRNLSERAPIQELARVLGVPAADIRDALRRSSKQ